MVPKLIRLLFSSFFILSCGGEPAGSQIEGHVPSGSASPFLMSVDPAAGGPGTSLRIEGIGFSLVAAENVVIVGGASANASLYGVTENSGEFLTCEIPEESTAGDGILFVTVGGVSSNALPFTVTP